MSDDQGWGDIEYNSHPVLKTPNLNEMAAKGLRLDRFYSASPVCSPTRASVLTGRNGNRMGCFSFGYSIRPEEITIAELLREKGYGTAHFGKWHIGPIQKESKVNPGNSGFDFWLSSINFFDLDPLLSRNGKIERIEGEGSMILVDEALKYIEKCEKENKPYFIVIWFASPHTPHIPDWKHKLKYPDQPEDHKNFYAEISAMDEAMGVLRKGIREKSNSENTLLWFCGDNGGLDYYGRTGGAGAKGSIYEGGLRVPGIVEWPVQIRENSVSKFPSYTSDIFPTIADICKIDAGKRPLDGVSLRQVFNSPKDSVRKKGMGFWRYGIPGRYFPKSELMDSLYSLQEAGIPSQLPDLPKPKEIDLSRLYFNSGHAAWLEWPFKLHKKKLKNGPVVYELYNLKTDPYERTNLYFVNTKIANRLQLELENWQESVNRSYKGLDYSE